MSYSNVKKMDMPKCYTLCNNNVLSIKSIRCKRVINVNNTILVLAHLYKNPRISLRIISG